MKFLKSYSKFRLIKEELVSSTQKINWGVGEFEIKELFRIFNDLRDELPEEFVINGETFYLDKSIFGEVGKAMDFEPEEFEPQCEDISAKPTNPSNEPVTSNDLLKMKKFHLKKDGSEVDAAKYYDFIKFARKLFWTGSPYQMTESDVEKLANDSNEIGRAGFDEYRKDSDNYTKMKFSYEKIMDFLKEKGAEDRFNTSGVFKDFPDIDKEAYQLAVAYKNYASGSFDHFDKAIERGEKMPLSSIIEINGKWYLVGGNRRMSYYCLSKINPVVWKIKLN